MNSRLFNGLMGGPSRFSSGIPGMQMPQFSNPSPDGRFIFPSSPAPITAAPITPPPGMGNLDPTHPPTPPDNPIAP